MSGTAIGTQRTCKVRGLAPARANQFQSWPSGHSSTSNAVFGAFSNIATGTTRRRQTGTVHDLAIVGTTELCCDPVFTEVGTHGQAGEL